LEALLEMKISGHVGGELSTAQYLD
jgi:hypothetical protein